MRASFDADGANPEILPVVVVARSFPARPSSLPEIRDFVRRHTGRTSFTEDDIRALGERTSQELLAAAGTSDTIEVSLRISSDRAEVDVLRSEPVPEPGRASPDAAAADRALPAVHEVGTAAAATAATTGARPGATASGPDPGSFTEWFADALRREGMTMDAAARRLGVSVKTVSRWMNGATEPRLRDLARMREIFGELPFP